MPKVHIMKDGPRSRRREREAAFLWIGWGGAYLVAAVVWAARLRWPPAGHLVWGPIFVYAGWTTLRRSTPSGAHWFVGLKSFFLATALLGVSLLMITLAAT